MKEIQRGDIVKVADVKKGRVRVVLKSGKEKNIELDPNNEFPQGTIESLLPLVERALAYYPGIVGSDDADFWLNLREKAPLSPEKAIITLRQHGFSSRVVGLELVRRIDKLSGLNTERQDLVLFRQVVEDTAEEIRKLYVATTEVRPRRPRQK